MFCPVCGKENDEENKFCRKCGWPLNGPEVIRQPASSSYSQAMPPVNPIRPPKPWYKRIWVWLLIIFIGLPMLVGTLSSFSGNEKQPVNASDMSGSEHVSSNEASEQPNSKKESRGTSSKAAISREEYIESASEIPYEDLVREPDKYKGTAISTTVKISQIMEDGLLSLPGYRGYEKLYNNEWNIIYELPPDSPRIIQDDSVTFYGEYDGIVEVTRALTGAKDYVPRIKALYHTSAAEAQKAEPRD